MQALGGNSLVRAVAHSGSSVYALLRGVFRRHTFESGEYEEVVSLQLRRVRVQKRPHGVTRTSVEVGARRAQDGTKAALERKWGGGGDMKNRRQKLREKLHLLQRLLSASTRERHHAKGNRRSTIGGGGRALGWSRTNAHIEPAGT